MTRINAQTFDAAINQIRLIFNAFSIRLPQSSLADLQHYITTLRSRYSQLEQQLNRPVNDDVLIAILALLIGNSASFLSKIKAAKQNGQFEKNKQALLDEFISQVPDDYRVVLLAFFYPCLPAELSIEFISFLPENDKCFLATSFIKETNDFSFIALMLKKLNDNAILYIYNLIPNQNKKLNALELTCQSIIYWGILSDTAEKEEFFEQYVKPNLALLKPLDVIKKLPFEYVLQLLIYLKRDLLELLEFNHSYGCFHNSPAIIKLCANYFLTGESLANVAKIILLDDSLENISDNLFLFLLAQIRDVEVRKKIFSRPKLSLELITKLFSVLPEKECWSLLIERLSLLAPDERLNFILEHAGLFKTGRDLLDTFSAITSWERIYLVGNIRVTVEDEPVLEELFKGLLNFWQDEPRIINVKNFINTSVPASLHRKVDFYLILLAGEALDKDNIQFVYNILSLLADNKVDEEETTSLTVLAKLAASLSQEENYDVSLAKRLAELITFLKSNKINFYSHDEDFVKINNILMSAPPEIKYNVLDHKEYFTLYKEMPEYFNDWYKNRKNLTKYVVAAAVVGATVVAFPYLHMLITLPAVIALTVGGGVSFIAYALAILARKVLNIISNYMTDKAIHNHYACCKQTIFGNNQPQVNNNILNEQRGSILSSSISSSR